MYLDLHTVAGGFFSWSGVESTRRLSGFVPIGGGFSIGGSSDGVRSRTAFAFTAERISASWLSASDDPDAIALADPADLSFGIRSFGFLVRHYFDREEGSHVGAAALISSLSTSRDGFEEPSGFGLTLDGGYDFRFAPAWAIGPFGRLGVYSMSVRETSTGPDADIVVVLPLLGVAVRRL